MTLAEYRRRLADHLKLLGQGKAQENGFSRGPDLYRSGVANGLMEAAAEAMTFLNDDNEEG